MGKRINAFYFCLRHFDRPLHFCQRCKTILAGATEPPAQPKRILTRTAPKPETVRSGCSVIDLASRKPYDFIAEHPVSIKNLLITVTAAGRTAIDCRPAEYVGTHPALWGLIPPNSSEKAVHYERER